MGITRRSEWFFMMQMAGIFLSDGLNYSFPNIFSILVPQRNISCLYRPQEAKLCPKNCFYKKGYHRSCVHHITSWVRIEKFEVLLQLVLEEIQHYLINPVSKFKYFLNPTSSTKWPTIGRICHLVPGKFHFSRIFSIKCQILIMLASFKRRVKAANFKINTGCIHCLSILRYRYAALVIS